MAARADALLSGLAVDMSAPGDARVYSLRDSSRTLGVRFATKADLLQAAHAFRDRRPETGLLPIVIGSPSREFGMVDDADDREEGRNGVDVITANARELLFDGPEADPTDARWRWLPAFDSPLEPAYDPDDERFWVDVEPERSFAIPYEGQTFCLGLFDASTGADAIEQMNWTDGNMWPAHVHADVARHWQERHGAEVVALDCMWMEMSVPEPLTDRRVAFELAVEQFGYADTIGRANYDSINEVASGLLVNTTWTFWWD